MQKILNEVGKIVDDHEYLKRSYFHTPQSTAAGRRKNENLYGLELNFETKEGDKYEIRRSYKESCKNIYYSLEIRLNGLTKDIRALKALIK